MSATSDAPKAYSREDAARLYGISLDTVRRAINKGDLKAKRVGRVIRVSEEALAKWWASLEDA